MSLHALNADTNAPAQLTVLGDHQRTLACRVADYWNSGVRLITPERVATGAAVKVEWSNTLLLGEICFCEPCDGQFAVGLYVEHAIYNTVELGRLAQRILDESI